MTKQYLSHRCLIAPPDLADDFFANTVIYIARHDGNKIGQPMLNAGGGMAAAHAGHRDINQAAATPEGISCAGGAIVEAEKKGVMGPVDPDVGGAAVEPVVEGMAMSIQRAPWVVGVVDIDVGNSRRDIFHGVGCHHVAAGMILHGQDEIRGIGADPGQHAIGSSTAEISPHDMGDDLGTHLGSVIALHMSPHGLRQRQLEQSAAVPGIASDVRKAADLFRRIVHVQRIQPVVFHQTAELGQAITMSAAV